MLWYLLEAPHWGASNEYHNIWFHGEMKKKKKQSFLLQRENIYAELCTSQKHAYLILTSSNLVFIL